MAAERFTDLSRVTDSNSDPLSGGLWYFYTKGTLTPLAVYTTDALDVAHDHPVVADAGGLFPAIYFDSALEYRGIQKNAAGATIQDIPLINTEVIERRDGRANINARTASTAAALETLADTYAGLDGFAGATHTVEVTPYFSALNLDGNGATLQNSTNSVNIWEYGALTIGFSHPATSAELTQYSVASISGATVTMTTAGDSASLPAGCIAQFQGALFYTAQGADIYRNKYRRRVIASAAGVLTLDRALPLDLVADTPITVANADEGVAEPGTGEVLKFLDAPRISNIKLVSDYGKAIARSAALDLFMRDFQTEGRTGFALNAHSFGKIENFTFRVWAKVVELSDSSEGTVVSGFTGLLYDNAADPYDDFIMAIGENSKHCIIENFNIDCGPKTAGIGYLVTLPPGVGNKIRHGKLFCPAATGTVLYMNSRAEAGMTNEGCVFEDIEIHAVTPRRFVKVLDGGAGLSNFTVRGITGYGAPTYEDVAGYPSAISIKGTEGLVEDLWFENGACHIDAATANTVFRNNYFPLGFSNLTQALLQANSIYDNDSDANRLLQAAAHRDTSSTVVNTTVANTIYGASNFPAGSLAPGDTIHIGSMAITNSSGGTNCSARLSVTSIAATTGLGSLVTGVASTPIEIVGRIYIATDIAINYTFLVGGDIKSGQFPVSSIAANGLSVNLEWWVADAANGINVRGTQITAAKPGMWSLARW